MMKKIAIPFTAALLTAVLLIIGGCSTDNQAEVDDTNTNSTPTEQQEESTPDKTEAADDNTSNNTTPNAQDSESLPTEGSYPLNDALAAFDKEYNAPLTEIKYDEDNGIYNYKIKGFKDGTEYKMKFDSNTGDVIEKKSEQDNDDDETFNFTDAISPVEAYELAMDQVGGDFGLDSWKIEKDNEILVYEFELTNGNNDDVEVKIDAQNKTVIEVDQ